MKRIYLIFLCFICLLLVGCTSSKTKEVGTLDTFQTVCVSNGLDCIDKLSDYQAQEVNYITGAIKGTLDDLTIEMVVYDNEENAKKAQSQHIASFMGMKGTAVTAHNEKGKNYKSFNMISNNYYMVSNRIENTLIFSKTPLTNKDKIDKILTEMGY